MDLLALLLALGAGVVLLPPNGAIAATATVVPGIPVRCSIQTTNTHESLVDGDGSLWLWCARGNSRAHSLFRVSRNGAVRTFIVPRRGVSDLTAWEVRRKIIEAPERGVFVVTKSHIRRVTAQGRVREVVAVPRGSEITGVAYAGGESFWFTTRTGRVATLARVNNGRIEQRVESGPGPLGNPPDWHAEVVRPDGSLWMRALTEYRPGVEVRQGTWLVDSAGEVRLRVPDNTNATRTACFVDADGALLLAGGGSRRMTRVTTEGTQTDLPGVASHAGPDCPVAAPDRSLWWAGDLIRRRTLSGAFMGFNVPSRVRTIRVPRYSAEMQAVNGPGGKIWTSTAHALLSFTMSGRLSIHRLRAPDRPNHVHVFAGSKHGLWGTVGGAGGFVVYRVRV